jgi:F0F1-type ATP synthase assembly protein I
MNENSDENSHKKNKSNVLLESGKYLSLGLEIFLPIVLCALAGNLWLDKVYKTTPLWTVILTLFGFVVGMYKLFKTVLLINKESKYRK